MTKKILEVKNLKIDFIMDGQPVNAVHDVSFEVNRGEVLGIVGESGCGKSVTATSILRLLPKINTIVDANSEVLLDGEDITKLSDKEFRNIRGNRISMIFQEPMTSLNPVHTIGRQLVEMIQAHEKVSNKDAREIAISMLDKVGIPSAAQRMNEYPFQLSGGMRQRVMIAMALSCNPEILIADEPTTALDVTIQAQILELMNKLKDETSTAIMIITHDMGVVAEMCDAVMVMYAGEIVEYSSAKNIFKTPMHPYTIGLLNSIPRMDEDVDRLQTIEGTVPTLRNMPKVGCRFVDRCPFASEKCRLESPQLTDYEGHKVRCFHAGHLTEGGSGDGK